MDDYEVVHVTRHTVAAAVAALKPQVEALLALGWMLQGGVSITKAGSGIVAAQAMTVIYNDG